MSSLNQVNLIGRVGRDPELRYLPNGDAVCTISLATSETWKDKSSGEKKEATEWHRVTFFQRQAEVAAQYATNGALIFVSGKLTTRKWQDKDGKDTYRTEIRVSELKLLGKPGDGGGQGGERPAAAPRPAQRPAAAPAAGGFSDMDDDIPF